MGPEHCASIEQMLDDIALRIADIRNSYLLQILRTEEKLAQLEAVVARMRGASGSKVDTVARWVN